MNKLETKPDFNFLPSFPLPHPLENIFLGNFFLSVQRVLVDIVIKFRKKYFTTTVGWFHNTLRLQIDIRIGENEFWPKKRIT